MIGKKKVCMNINTGSSPNETDILAKSIEINGKDEESTEYLEY